MSDLLKRILWFFRYGPRAASLCWQINGIIQALEPTRNAVYIPFYERELKTMMTDYKRTGDLDELYFFRNRLRDQWIT